MSIGIIGIALAFALSNGTINLIKSQVDSILPSNSLQVFLKEKGSEGPVNVSFGGKSFENFTYDDVSMIPELDKNVMVCWPIPTNAMESFFSEISLNKDEVATAKFEENSVMSMNGPEPFETINNNLTLGRAPENINEVVVSLTTAEALLGTDRNINTLLNKTLYIKFGPQASIGRDDDRNKVVTFNIVGITSVNTMGYSVYLNMKDVLSLYENVFNVKRENMTFFEMYVYLNHDLNNNEIKATINKLNKAQDKLLFVGAADNMIDGVQVFMDTVRNVLIGFSSISVVVAILMIGIVIFISVIERIDEIGIIRAIGGRRKDIRNLFLSESMIIGLFAGSFGVLITMGLCSIINGVVAELIRMYGMQLGNVTVAVLDPMVAVGLILVCIILALIAGLIPSLKAARMDPIEALRRK
jgi:ABC-type antimicrobial peptide transport system permease subunit